MNTTDIGIHNAMMGRYKERVTKDSRPPQPAINFLEVKVIGPELFKDLYKLEEFNILDNDEKMNEIRDVFPNEIIPPKTIKEKDSHEEQVIEMAKDMSNDDTIMVNDRVLKQTEELMSRLMQSDSMDAAIVVTHKENVN